MNGTSQSDLLNKQTVLAASKMPSMSETTLEIYKSVTVDFYIKLVFYLIYIKYFFCKAKWDYVE